MQLQNTGHKGRSLHALIKKTEIGMQFPLNLKHLTSDCNLGFSYNYSFWFQVYTDWKGISKVIRSSVFEED